MNNFKQRINLLKFNNARVQKLDFGNNDIRTGVWIPMEDNNVEIVEKYGEVKGIYYDSAVDYCDKGNMNGKILVRPYIRDDIFHQMTMVEKSEIPIIGMVIPYEGRDYPIIEKKAPQTPYEKNRL